MKNLSLWRVVLMRLFVMDMMRIQGSSTSIGDGMVIWMDGTKCMQDMVRFI